MPRSRHGQETVATSNLLGLVDLGAGQWVSRESIVAVLNLATVPEAVWRGWAAAPGATESAVAPRSAIVTANGILLTTLHVQTLYRRIAAADRPVRGYLRENAPSLDSLTRPGA